MENTTADNPLSTLRAVRAMGPLAHCRSEWPMCGHATAPAVLALGHVERRGSPLPSAQAELAHHAKLVAGLNSFRDGECTPAKVRASCHQPHWRVSGRSGGVWVGPVRSVMMRSSSRTPAGAAASMDAARNGSKGKGHETWPISDKPHRTLVPQSVRLRAVASALAR